MHTDTKPPWKEAAAANQKPGDAASRDLHHPQLEGARQVDVAVVGGGITGLTAAHLLASAGLKVALVEGRRLGDGETGQTTAHLTELVDTRYRVLRDRFGESGARLVALGQRLAIDSIQVLADQWDVPLELTRSAGFLYAETEEERSALIEEHEVCRSLGVPTVMTESCPLPFATKGALRIEDQAQLNPVPYLRALASAFTAEGGQIFEETPVTAVEDGSPCRLVTAKGHVLADKVILATHVPFASRVLLQTKVAAYRSYALAAPWQGDDILLGLYWDSQSPYHYIRSHVIAGKLHVIVGGEDHRVGSEPGEEPAAFERLQSYVTRKFGALVGAPTYRWSGQILEPVDGLPYVGKDAGAKNVFVATGYAGNGLTWGTLAAFVLSDAIRELDNPWTELLDATRVKPFASAKSFLAENVAFPRHFLLDRLKSAKKDDELAKLAAGQGDVFRINGERLAVYRGDDGKVSACSAVCPHLGCLVHWNTTEKSWDCPCHGSRFSPRGEVLNGPASTPLPPKSL